MKKISLVITAAFWSCLSFAQQAEKPVFVCSYYGEPVSMPISIINSSADAMKAIRSITDVVGLEPNFELKQANIPNAAAIIINNKRYILYNPAFISRINNASGDKWAAIAILAHEIGHHLDGHTLSGTGSQPKTELEADQFSGFVLSKMGASLADAQSAIQVAGDQEATATHPGKEDRLVSIDNGWTKAANQTIGKAFTAKAIPSTQQQQQVATAVSNVSYSLKPEFVHFNIHFAADAVHPYYITKEEKLVTIRGDKVIELGKMVGTEDEDFPFMIKTYEGALFLLTGRGVLLNKNAEKAGYATQP